MNFAQVFVFAFVKMCGFVVNGLLFLARFHVLSFSFLDGVKIPNCTEEILRETSIQRATDIEKLLLSLPPFIKTYPLWISHENITSQKYVPSSFYFPLNYFPLNFFF